MKIVIAADHGGYPAKAAIVNQLRGMGHEVHDLGAHQYDALDDYPDFAAAVGKAIQSGHADRGIILCGSGVGATVAANKMKGVRACLCHDTYSAHQAVEHDAVNVLCLGARIVGSALTAELVNAFITAHFSTEERHHRRLEKVNQIESQG